MSEIFTDVRVAVIGRGRLGCALAAAIGAGPPLTRGARPQADVAAVVLAVPDAAVAPLAATLEPGPAVGHCSGALGLDDLAGHRERFSLHPLMTLPAGSGPERLRGAGAAVDGSSPAALELARSLARRAGLEPFELAAGDRALYHAGASIASNFLVALEGAAERVLGAVGVERRHVAALARASLRNWEELGAAAALTGPIARGDRETVARQRRAIGEREGDLLGLYDALAQTTRALAEAT